MPWDPAQQADATPPPAKADEKPVEKATEAPVEAKSIEPEVENLDENGKPIDEKAAAVEKPADPETDKGLSVLQKAEKKQRDAIAAAKAEAKAEIDVLRAQVAPDVKLAKEFQAHSAKAQSSVDAVMDVLRTLGVPKSMYAEISRRSWFASPEAANDPKSKAQAEEASRQYESKSALDQALAQITELKERLDNTEKQTKQEQVVNRFMDSVQKAATDSTPLVKQKFASNPTKARNALMQIAVDMGDGDEPPDPADVVAKYEEHLTAELEELGYSPKQVAKAKQTAATEVARPAKTLDPTSTGATPVPVNKTLSPDEKRKKLLQEMPWDSEVS